MPLRTQDALIYLMIMVSAADRAMSDAELRRIGSVVRNLPIFSEEGDAELTRISAESAALFNEKGLGAVLDDVAAAIPANLGDTAYALAVEVAAADLLVRPEESRVLQMIRARFNVPALTAAAIEASARARHRTL